MVYTWSTEEFTRKVKTIKDNLRDNDGFYSDRILARVVTKSGGSGIYNRGVTLTYTDTLVSGVAVFRPEYVVYDEDVQTIDSDAQFTCKVDDKGTIRAANQLWLNYTLSGTTIISGTMYEIKSDRPSLFNLDHIFELTIAVKQNA